MANARFFFQIQKKLDLFSLEFTADFNSGILVIRGESGAGKTTILNCIAGLTKPDTGKIIISDQTVFDSIARIDIPTRKRHIGYVFQNYALFPNMTVEKNISYGLTNLPEYKNEEKRKELLDYMEYLIEAFHIAPLREKYPYAISGGEKQRTALARAIVTRPKLLLMDEPFSALDTNTKEIIYSEFGTFIKTFDIPILLITHDPHEAKLFADQIIEIKEGKIITKLGEYD